MLVTSSFTGTELVLFGSVERDAATVPRRGGYDIVVTVIGPRETLVTRRKDRVLGIWANAESRTFVTRRLSRRAQQPAARRDRAARTAAPAGARPEQCAAARSRPPASQPGRDDAFRDALIRLRKQRGLYREEPTA